MFALWLASASAWTREYQHQLFIAGVTIAVVLLAAALVLAWVRRLNKKKASFKLSAGDQLAEFRVLYERGELSADEYHKLRAILTDRMQTEVAGQETPNDAESTPSVVQVNKPNQNGPAGPNGTPGAPGS